MDINFILPFLVFFPMAGALIGYWIGRKNKQLRNYFSWFVTGITFVASLMLYGKDAAHAMENFCGLGLYFVGDGMRVVFAVITTFVWFLTTLFSDEYFKEGRNRNRYYFFMLLTLGSTLGIFLSADFYTTFIFFEIMTFTSFVLVIHDESERTKRAANTYLAIAVLGGLVTLMGLFMLYQKTGTLQMDLLMEAFHEAENKKEFYIMGILVLVGFGTKASVFPMHIWLPEAYTVAPAPASALLSCVLTKSGLYGVMGLSCIVFLHDYNWGMLILILGVITMLLGATLAVFSVDLKRTLACSSLSQIGFILIGVGMNGILGHHNAIASAGTVLHFANHSFIKLTLFMAAGVVYMNLHELNLNKIRGYGKDKPLLKGVFLMGALGIAGVPIWNGYISKTLLHESIVEYIHILEEAGQSVTFFKTVEILFLFAGGLTVAYMTKIFVAVFIESPDKNSIVTKQKGSYMNKISATVLAVSAILFPIFGILPHQTMDKIADMSRGFFFAEPPAHAVHYFAWINLQGAIISIVVGAIVYFLFVRKVLMAKDEQGILVYLDRWPEWLNLENKVYRPVLMTILPFVGAFFARVVGSLTEAFIMLTKIFIFNKDDGKVVPPEDAYFSACTHDAGTRSGFRENLAKSLLFFGIGVTIAMLYMLL